MADSEDDGWRFAVDEVGEDATEDADGEGDADPTDTADTGAGGDGDVGDEAGGNVAGAFTLDEEVEPGQPTVENTLFVALGVAVTLLFFLSVAGVI